MPAPLTTAGLAFAAILLPINEVSTIIVGAAAVVNQFLVTLADLRAERPDV